MHGKYKCSVKTDLGTREMEQELVVISQSYCKLNDWRVISQPDECRETFKFDCRNMFPKPVTSCGLWNSKLEKFIRSVMVDISEEPNKQTYRIRYSDKFQLSPPSGTITKSINGSSDDDLLQFAGHLMFKCDIIIPETSWKLSLVHRMFDHNDGCLNDPLDSIERMRLNYSHYATTRMQQAGYYATKQLEDFEMLPSNLKYELTPPYSSKSSKVELNCWHKPRLGSLAHLSCANKVNQARLVGANLLECRPEGWVPVLEPVNQKNLKKLPPHRRPSRPSRRVANSSADEDASEIMRTKHRFEHDNTKLATADQSDSSRPSDNNNDLEEPALLRPQTSSSSATSTITLQSMDVETIPVNQMILSSNEPKPVELVQQSTLTPAQLAALLPTCVSIRRSHLLSTIVSNKFPFSDEARILESSSMTNPRNKQLRNNSQDKQQQNSFFNFSSSGSKETINVRLSEQSIMLVISLTSLTLISILNMQQQRFSF